MNDKHDWNQKIITVYRRGLYESLRTNLYEKLKLKNNKYHLSVWAVSGEK